MQILEYLLRSPYQNVLVLEDDALLLAGDAFDIEFDRQMRLVRPDWTQVRWAFLEVITAHDA